MHSPLHVWKPGSYTGTRHQQFRQRSQLDLSQLMTSVSAGQKNEPPSFALRRALGLLLPDSTLRALIPPVIYRLNRCAPDDISVLAQFITSLNALAQTKTQDEAYKSMLLYYLIVFSETWETPTPPNLVMETRFVDVKISDGGFYEDGGRGIYKLNALYCAFSKEKSETCNNFDVGNYDSSAIIYERDGYWNKSAVIPSQASVLLLSGRLDPQTPHKYAEYLLEVLEGDNKELIAFDYASHGTIINTQLVGGDPYSDTCAMKVLASYVKNGGDLAKFDKSCVDEMPGFNMVIRTEDLYSYLSVNDAYDGVYNESLSSQ